MSEDTRDDVRQEVSNLIGASAPLWSSEDEPSHLRELSLEEWRTLLELEARIDHLESEKEDAVGAQEFERAARLCTEADELKQRRRVMIGTPEPRPILLHEYDLFVPLRYNDATPVEKDKLARLRQLLVDQLGGLTDLRQRFDGVWKIGGVDFRDELVVYRVLAEPACNLRVFFKRMKEQLKAELGQKDILIVERRINVL